MKRRMRTFNLYELLQHNALVRGEAPAAISAERTVTHGQFLQQVDRLAGGLNSRGVGKGDRVCVLAQNSIEYLELYGACARSGAIAYPINWRLTAAEVSGVIALAEPKMLVVSAANMDQLAESDLSAVPERIVMSTGAKGFTPFGQLYADPCPAAEVSSDDPFAIISTAATAGAPRGAILTHANLIFAGYQAITALGLSASDRHLAALPLFHIASLGLSLATMQAGGANVVMETFDANAAATMMDAHNVSLIPDFPPILSMLLQAREKTGGKWESLRYVFGLDAPDTIKQLLRHTHAQFWTGFGQAETSGFGVIMNWDEKPGAAGRALPLAQVRCVDDGGEDVPVGADGEIVMRGPLVFAGYWRDAVATDFAFRQGWHHTGDVGRFDDDGYLYYRGRKPEKELIKTGGENVYPAEVEGAIRSMHQVTAVCVIGVADQKWGEAVKAVVELEVGASLGADKIISAVASQIASYKKPRVVEFVSALPRTAQGEIDRAAVKAAHG